MEKYQFIKQIGHGKYGDIWLVKGSQTKRNYVLKRIDFNQSAKREQRAAHLEAKLLCTVRHPNIIAYIDSFYNSTRNLFIVMSYCEHKNLHDVIKSRNGAHFEEEEIVRWLVQICMALKYIHDQSIVHRDIKTENIFLTKQKMIKIGNFGIAYTYNSAEDMLSTLTITPCYSSPETFQGAAFGLESDVWSLGCCIYEIAMLKYAFIAQDISCLMEQNIIFKLSTIVEIYSSELFEITLSMLNLKPEKRPSATQLLLNDYIRKHILLLLRTSSERINTPQSCICKTKKRASLDMNSKISSFVCSEHEIKSKVIKSKWKFKTIPDVNGNGDANDNSQQEATGKENITDVKRKHYFDYNKSNSNLSLSEKQDKTVDLSNTKESRGNSTLSSQSNKNSEATMKQFEKRLSFYAQKVKSENSFQLLNTITNSINISRFKSLDSINVNKHSFPTKYIYGVSPPKSAEDLLTLSKMANSYLLRRPATSAEVNFNVISSDFSRSPLPQIKECLGERNITTVSNVSIINLPPLHHSQHQCPKNNEVIGNNSLPNLEESIVDKFLLQNIMTCNKIAQQKDSIALKSSSHHKIHGTLIPITREILYHDNTNRNS